MRPFSVSMMKRNSAPTCRAPRAGTALRAFFDALHENKGKIIRVEGQQGMRPGQMRDFHGLDVRLITRGGRGRRWSEYVLAGEWFGRVYVDYIAEHLEKQRETLS